MVEPSLNPVVPQSRETAKDLGATDKPVAKDLVVFPIPSGFIPPESVEPGESFEAVCRIQYRRGKLILEAVEGHEVHLEEVPTPKMKPSTFEDAVEEGLPPGEGMA
jgi:hypothetical protein